MLGLGIILDCVLVRSRSSSSLLFRYIYIWDNMAASSFTLIDGSTMEGGGQVLRNSVSLSALLNKPIRITKVRAKRDRPGTTLIPIFLPS